MAEKPEEIKDTKFESVSEAPAINPLQANMASPQRTMNRERTVLPTSSESGAEGISDQRPGIQVDRTLAVVLASRLGRPIQPLPKIDPNDPTEATKYHSPDPFERGEVINLTDSSHVSQDPKHLQRLFAIGAIGYLDHPDAREAETALVYRRNQESTVAVDRGVMVGLTGMQTGQF